MIHVTGLASSGQESITIEAPGIERASIPVTLTPAGIGFSGVVNQVQIGDIVSLELVAFRLNPATLIPEQRQPLAWGLAEPAAVGLTASERTLVTFASERVTFDPGSESVFTRLRAAAAGQTRIGLTQPGGFSEPSQQSSFLLTIR